MAQPLQEALSACAPAFRTSQGGLPGSLDKPPRLATAVASGKPAHRATVTDASYTIEWKHGEGGAVFNRRTRQIEVFCAKGAETGLEHP